MDNHMCVASQNPFVIQALPHQKEVPLELAAPRLRNQTTCGRSFFCEGSAPFSGIVLPWKPKGSHPLCSLPLASWPFSLAKSLAELSGPRTRGGKSSNAGKASEPSTRKYL